MREPNSPGKDEPSSDAVPAPRATPYAPPTLVKLGELKDLTANGSFFGDT
jgi:hypothetical protein